jgi:hypothetical protein
MTCQREHALLGLVVPDLDSMVISSTDKHGLCIMKCDTSNWAIVVFELIYKRLSSIIKQIDGAIVKRCKYPRPVLVERKALHPLGFGFKFGNHLSLFNVFKSD